MILADTTLSLGLSNTACAYYVRGGVGRDSDRSSTNNRPYIEIGVFGAEKAKERGGRQLDATVRFHIRDDRDKQRANTESRCSQVAGRLVDILNATAWTGGSVAGWSLSAASHLRSYPLPFPRSNEKEVEYIVEFRVHADKYLE